jgi:predicted ATPase
MLQHKLQYTFRTILKVLARINNQFARVSKLIADATSLAESEAANMILAGAFALESNSNRLSRIGTPIRILISK